MDILWKWFIFPLFHGSESFQESKWCGWAWRNFFFLMLILESRNWEFSGSRKILVREHTKLPLTWETQIWGIWLVKYYFFSLWNWNVTQNGEPVFNPKSLVLNAFANFPQSLINLIGSCLVIPWVPSGVWMFKVSVSPHHGLFRAHFSQLCWKQLHQIQAFWKQQRRRL